MQFHLKCFFEFVYLIFQGSSTVQTPSKRVWPAFIKHTYVTPCFWGLSSRPAHFICQYSLFSGKRAVYRCHERCLSPSASAKSELVFWLRRGQGAALTCILFFSLLSWLCIQFPESSLASSHRHDRAKGKETEWKKGAGGGERQSVPLEMVCVHGNEGKLEDGFAV